MTIISENDMFDGSPLPGWRRWFWNVVEGSIALIVDGIEMLVGSGDAAIIPPDTPHSARIAGPAGVTVTDFPVRHDLPGVDRT